MNNTLILTTVPHQRVRPADGSRRSSNPATPRGLIATWRWRRQFRWELEQVAKANPHLIDDIGLTRRQFETEIAKRFWEV